jgi:hypothetical protein
MGSLGRDYLQEVAGVQDIPYLALDSYFEGMEKETTFPHDGHWNSFGHSKAAMAISEFLCDRGIFKNRSTLQN